MPRVTSQILYRAPEAVGEWVMRAVRPVGDVLDFLGRTVIGIVRLIVGRSRHLTLNPLPILQQASIETLPVVALFGVAAGAVLTLIGTQQLDKFGIPLLAPKLVGIVVLREIGPLMTGIVIAGSVASAFAAEVAAAMFGRVPAEDQEDSVDPVDVLVAPRVLALMLSGPLLVAYANALALLGATAVGAGMFGNPARAYFDSVLAGLGVKNAIAGLVKGAVFGFVAGLAGCYHGFRGATGIVAIGRAVRNGVVAAVVWVGLASAALTFIFRWIKL
jgi:phospholipid/cholesterol/gamma-HCH transport system permease protein